MLEHRSIEVWRLELNSELWSADQIAAWRKVLSAAELTRADAFRGEEHRQDYIAAHAALRSVLGRHLGSAPEAVQFLTESTTERGSFAAAGGGGSRVKPALAKEHAIALPGATVHSEVASGLKFNLSHTRGMALICVALGMEVGVDIEWQRPMRDLEMMAEAVMSQTELTLWRELPSNHQSRAFYDLWTRKESYLKAIGLGLFRDLHAVTVPMLEGRLPFTSPDDYEAIQVRDDEGSGRWIVADLPAQNGYSASVCFELSGREGKPSIRLIDYEPDEKSRELLKD